MQHYMVMRTRYQNVIASFGPETGERIVIGAHYDHLGYGGESSLAPDQNVPHVGAMLPGFQGHQAV